MEISTFSWNDLWYENRTGDTVLDVGAGYCTITFSYTSLNKCKMRIDGDFSVKFCKIQAHGSQSLC